MSTPYIRRSITAAVAVALGIYAAAGCTSENGGTEPGPSPAISLTVSPGSATIAPGGSADVTGTLTRSGGFTGAVVLTVEGVPTGVTGSISNESTSGGVTTATITIAVDAATAPGTYTLTVRGAGSGVSDATATFTLSVSGFVITLTPATLTINQSDQGSTEVTITRTSFNGTVALALENAPAGVTGTFDPTPAPGTASTLTIQVDESVAMGEYSLTVRGTATGLNDQTATLALTVALQPDFSLAANPNAFSIEQGMSGQSSISITRTNFTEAVTLTLGGAPAGMTGTFDPAAPTGDVSTLTIDVDVSVAPGMYNVTVDGASSIGGRSENLTITVTAAPASYTMTLTPDALTIEQGEQGTSDVNLARINFSGAVALTLEDAPTGVTGVFSPAAPTGDASTLTLNVGGATVPGVYTLTVRGTAAGLADRTGTLTLTVGNFSIAVDPNTLTIEQGMSDQATVTISRTNFTGEVSLSLTGAPAGVTGDFDPQATTGTTSTLTVSVDSATVPGTYELTVVGSSGSGAAPGVNAAVDMEASLTLTVEEIPNYGLSVEPPSLTIEQGMSGQAAVSISRTNFTEAVTLSLGGPPPTGMTGMFDPAAPTGNSSTVTVMVDATVPAGEYNLTVDGDASIGMRSTPFTVTVTEAPDFSLSLDPAELSIEQGMNGQTTVSIARTNFMGDVTLTLEDAPSGVTGVFNPDPATGNTSTLTISVDGATTPGTYNLRVDGVGDPGTRSASLELTVTAPPPGFSLSMSPSGATVPQGGATSATINITRTGGFSDNVALSVTGMPSGMTAAPTPASAGGNSATLDVSVGSGVAPNTYVLTVAGDASGFAQETTTFTVTVTMAGGGTTVIADFSSCSMDEKPIWVAFQDGTGSWMQVMGVMDVYTFTLNASKGGAVWVAEDASGDRVLNVIYATAAEFTTLASSVCDVPGTKTVDFTVAGMDMGDLASVSLGDTPASTFVFADGAYQFLEVPAGPQNLVAFKSVAADPGTNAKVIVRRGLDIADMGDAGLLDFDGTDASVPETGSVTVAGLTAGEFSGGTFSFASAGSCQVADLHGVFGASFDVHAPAASQRVGSDRLVTVINAVDSMLSDRARGVTDIRSTVGGTITLPPEMPAPTVTPLVGGNYLRLEGMAQLATEYSGFAVFVYANTDSDRTVSLSATGGYLESLTATLGLDDFTGVPGWMDDYAPATTDMAEWSVIGFGSGFLDEECTATSFGTASRNGMFP